MRGKRNLNRSLFQMMATLLLVLILAPEVSGNPIPMDIGYPGRTGGTPVPDEEVGENLTISLKEETIRARLYEDHASINAEYVFYNGGTSAEDIRICLPFVNEPWDLEASVDGHDLQYTWSRYEYISVFEYGYGNSMDYHRESLSSLHCIIFTISIDPDDISKVEMKYRSEISTYDTRLNPYVMYFFSYLVGSGRSWNHTIDKAVFELKMSKDLYDRTGSTRWNISKNRRDVTFTMEFQDWTPERDFVYLSWENDRGALYDAQEELKIFWRETENRIRVISCCGGSTILLIISLTAILLYRRKKKKGPNRLK
ncbi:MAG: hypothetical protein KAH57_02330 [Thermoplasmata archaeon]|nr:hypothetical protein [Thermoplasmata archaeon]